MSPQFWSVPELWPGATFVLFGGGPSLTASAVNACRGRIDNGRQVRAIAVNDALRLAPWTDVHYFCDDKWWGWHHGKDWYRAFKGLRVTLENPNLLKQEPSLKSVQNVGHKGLCAERTGLATGRNGGYQAINLAVHLGAARILLLGYDMHAPLVGDKVRTHWFGDHPGNTSPGVYAMMLPNFETLVAPLAKRGVEIVNCTPGSALRCFARGTLESALPDLRALESAAGICEGSQPAARAPGPLPELRA